MRHYVVDPDDEERLLKVPPLVVSEIKEEAIAAAVQRVEALLFPWPNTWPGMIRRGDVITAIRGES